MISPVATRLVSLRASLLSNSFLFSARSEDVEAVNGAAGAEASAELGAGDEGIMTLQIGALDMAPGNPHLRSPKYVSVSCNGRKIGKTFVRMDNDFQRRLTVGRVRVSDALEVTIPITISSSNFIAHFPVCIHMLPSQRHGAVSFVSSSPTN